MNYYKGVMINAESHMHLWELAKANNISMAKYLEKYIEKEYQEWKNNAYSKDD